MRSFTVTCSPNKQADTATAASTPAGMHFKTPHSVNC